MENINFFVPADIDLSKSEDGEDVRKIRGFASTSEKDRQDEEIVQKGMDITDFVDYGWFNYDHDNTKILGYPDKVNTKVGDKGFFVEGVLLKGVPLADHIWELAKSLKKSNAPRKLGFSVEGKVLERGENGKILKAKIYNVAITPNPVNPAATWDAVVKSFVGDTPEGAATAGYETNIGDENNGAALKTESLDAAFKNLAYLIGDNEEAKKKLRELKTCLVKKSLTSEETILYLQLYKGLSRQQALEVINSM